EQDHRAIKMPALEHAALFPEPEEAIAETLKQMFATHPDIFADRLNASEAYRSFGRASLLFVTSVGSLVGASVLLASVQ
ncbi:hypothetical protein, partial [Microvirga subterranea]|uniref:hypothetical protein n=1 Tax=Microvirga subterranea TaxID=186651 RepID=UPI001AECDD20